MWGGKEENEYPQSPVGFRGIMTLTLNTGAQGDEASPLKASGGRSLIHQGDGPGQPRSPAPSVRKSAGCSDAEDGTLHHDGHNSILPKSSVGTVSPGSRETKCPAWESCDPPALSPPQRGKPKGDSCKEDHREGEHENKGWQRE